jgi:hypothetical protein
MPRRASVQDNTNKKDDKIQKSDQSTATGNAASDGSDIG